MPVQDDAREQQTIMLFNLSVPEDRQRSDIDAYLEFEELEGSLPFELKSTTKSSVATVRDFGPQHIAKWRDMHWLFAFYGSGNDRTPMHCRYASPANMAPWIAEKESYIRPDLVLAERAPQRMTEGDLLQVVGADKDVYTTDDAKAIMKMQWSAKQYRDNADMPNGGYSRARMLMVLQEGAATSSAAAPPSTTPASPTPIWTGWKKSSAITRPPSGGWSAPT